MILSNLDIHSALDSGALVIEPEPTPRLPTEDGEDCPYQTSAVDLCLGDEISWIREKLAISINLRDGGLPKLLGENSENRKLNLDEPYTLEPGKFVLARTHERIELPIREDPPWLAARVEGRSSYARCGLLVHFTAPTIHCGYSGTITLEIMNFGAYPISLYPRTPICQLIVEELKSQPFRNDSQFHGQTKPSGPAA